MIGLGTLFIIARFTIRTIKHRFFVGEEILISLGWACMVAACSCYIVVAPAIFRISAVERGDLQLYETFPKDVELGRRIYFTNAVLFFSCIWSVKCALLLQCKRLVERQRIYIIVWWSIMTFTLLSFVGAVITVLVSCPSLHAWFTYRKLQAIIVSVEVLR
jgi:hypothetical protein